MEKKAITTQQEFPMSTTNAETEKLSVKIIKLSKKYNIIIYAESTDSSEHQQLQLSSKDIETSQARVEYSLSKHE